MQGIARTLAEWETRAVDEQSLTVPWRGGALPARTYLPRGSRGGPFFSCRASTPRASTSLASSGSRATSRRWAIPSSPSGRRISRATRISPSVTDAIEDAASWLSQQRTLAPDGRIGMMGISFAGGLSIVAAGRPSLANRVVAVLSLGGHGDLPRTLRYLCTGIQADGTRCPPHDYGVVIILLGVADQVVPADQVAPLREALLTFLEASRLDLVDKAQSAAEFERARGLASALPGTGAYADELRQPARRRASRTDPAAARGRARWRAGALTGALASAAGAGLPAARIRGQRDSRRARRSRSRGRSPSAAPTRTRS